MHRSGSLYSAPAEPISSSNGLKSVAKSTNPIIKSIVGAETSSKRAGESVEASHERVMIPPPTINSNTTFEDWFCEELFSSPPILTLSMELDDPRKFVLPDCLGDTSLVTTSLTITGRFIIPSFALFPASLDELFLGYVSFDGLLGESTGAVGLVDGTVVVWSDVFGRLPSLQRFYLEESNLRGSLPQQLPILLTTFWVSSTPLNGSIPDSLFNNFYSADEVHLLSFSVSNCLLSGTIPSALFQAFEGCRINTSFSFDISRNMLLGDLPPALLQPLESALTQSFFFDISHNDLTGSMPGNFFPSNLVSNTKSSSSFRIVLSDTIIGGAFPVLQHLTNINDFSFVATGTRFEGQLSGALFFTSWTRSPASFNLDLSNNGLTGSLPASFFTSSFLPGTNFTQKFAVSLSGNAITDFIPSSLFASLRFIKQFSFNVSKNELYGSIPPDILFDVFNTTILEVNLDLSGNRLDGNLPAVLLDSLQNTDAIIFVSFASNLLSGSVPSYCHATSLDLRYNNFSGALPSFEGCTKLNRLYVSHNHGLISSVPSSISTLPDMRYFEASNTSLTEPFTPTSKRFSWIDLSYSSLDLCSTGPYNHNFTAELGQCNLSCTQATHCPQFFPNCATQCSTPSTVSFCPAPPPSSEFMCINGTWTASSINFPTLHIPAGAGNIIVTGNVTSEVIVFRGFGSTIEIDGCATNLTQIVVQLSKGDLDRLGKSTTKALHPLIVVGGGNSNTSQCASLSNVAIVVKPTDEDECKKVKAERSVSIDGKTLGAFFVVDSSGCNRWWIILVAVVVPAIVVGTAASVIAGVLYNNHKYRSAGANLNGSKSAST